MENLFSSNPRLDAGETSVGAIRRAKRRGQANKKLAEAELHEEIQASAGIAEKVYFRLREVLRLVVQDIADSEPSAQVIYDDPFKYQVIGATDLLCANVGPQELGIQLRIKVKIVPRSITSPSNESNRIFWAKHLPDDAICFTFALEGGVTQAHDTRYLQGRWVTICRDGSIYLHPLSAGFGHYANSDLGGSVEGRGVRASMDEVRDFCVSVLASEKYWEYIARR